MEIEKTPLKDCYIIKPTILKDNRGTFFESFNKQRFEELTGLKTDFVQDNQSMSTKGVLRGLHFQTGDFAQTKLVRVVLGEVYDVAVDLRPSSPTFKKYFGAVLSDTNFHQLYIPKGFAHGFVTLSEKSIFSYKCDNYYNKESEAGIIYNDPILKIDWNFPDEELILSEKDAVLPTIEQLYL